MASNVIKLMIKENYLCTIDLDIKYFCNENSNG